MKFSFEKVEISLGLAVPHYKLGYRLSNGTILLPSGRGADGSYQGLVGTDGIYLYTGTDYRAVYDAENNIIAFEEII